MRKANSNIIEQTPILHRALEEARAVLPPGSRARDTSFATSDYTLTFDLITEYDPALAGDFPPIAWTRGRWNAFESQGDAADEVVTALKEHQAVLEYVYAGKYAA